MADNPDRDSKTEEPTEKKLADARGRGSVPVAREMMTLGSLCAMLAAAQLFDDRLGPEIAAALARLLETSGTIRLDSLEDATVLVNQYVAMVAYSLLPALAIIAAGGVLASVLQNVPQIAGQRIRPAWSRVSLAAGWKRMFGAQGAVDFLRALLKLAAVCAVTVAMLRMNLATVANALESDPAGLVPAIFDLCLRLVFALILLSALLAVADLAWSRLKWRRDLKMTRQEIKDEFKQQEGDPHLKSRIRSIARQRSGKRMMAKLPAATVVVANPTHYAVALRYVREDGGVPVVVAKGIDHLALRIRELAEGHAIPVVENKPLARALYEKVAVDQAIPAELYRAVAEIIHYLQVRKKYGRAAPASPGQASPRRS